MLNIDFVQFMHDLKRQFIKIWARSLNVIQISNQFIVGINIRFTRCWLKINEQCVKQFHEREPFETFYQTPCLHTENWSSIKLIITHLSIWVFQFRTWQWIENTKLKRKHNTHLWLKRKFGLCETRAIWISTSWNIPKNNRRSRTNGKVQSITKGWKVRAKLNCPSDALLPAVLAEKVRSEWKKRGATAWGFFIQNS